MEHRLFTCSIREGVHSGGVFRYRGPRNMGLSCCRVQSLWNIIGSHPSLHETAHCLCNMNRYVLFLPLDQSRSSRELQLANCWLLSTKVFNPLQGRTQTHLLADSPHGPHRCQKFSVSIPKNWKGQTGGLVYSSLSRCATGVLERYKLKPIHQAGI